MLSSKLDFYQFAFNEWNLLEKNHFCIQKLGKSLLFKRDILTIE